MYKDRLNGAFLNVKMKPTVHAIKLPEPVPTRLISHSVNQHRCVCVVQKHNYIGNDQTTDSSESHTLIATFLFFTPRYRWVVVSKRAMSDQTLLLGQSEKSLR